MPSNLTPSTAQDLGTFPFATFTASVAGTSAPYYEVWFKFTPAATQTLGLNIHAPIAGNYWPESTLWTGPPTAVVPYPTVQVDAINSAAVFPVVAGVTIYVRVRQANTGLGIDGPMSLTGTVAPNTPPGEGTLIAIPDADMGFWGAELTAAAGGVSRYNPAMPVAEWGDMLVLGGRTALNPKPTITDIKIYDDPLGAWTLVATIPGMLGNSATQQQIKASPGSGSFYFGGTTGGGAVFLHRASAAGVVLGAWTLPTNSKQLLAMAISRDDARVFYSSLNAGQAIHAYDLIGNAALPDLVAAAATYAQDLLVLADGSVIVSYQGTGSNQVKRFSAAGALLNTYSFPGFDCHRVARDPADDAATFWIWFHVGGQKTSRFSQVRVADGTVLVTFVAPIYLGGAANEYTDAAPTWGTSNTCPFLVYQGFGGGGGGGPEPPGGGGPGGPPPIAVPIPTASGCVPAQQAGSWVCLEGPVTVACTSEECS